MCKIIVPVVVCMILVRYSCVQDAGAVVVYMRRLSPRQFFPPLTGIMILDIWVAPYIRVDDYYPLNSIPIDGSKFITYYRGNMFCISSCRGIGLFSAEKGNVT